MNIAIFIISAIILFIYWQLWPLIKSKRSVGKNISFVELDNEITCSIKDKTGLIYFYSPSCSICRAQTPIINEIKEYYDNVLSINVFENIKTANSFKVAGTPSIIFLSGNKIAGHFVGVKKKTFIIQKLENI